MTGLPHRACPLVLAAPSGTGKTSIARALAEESDRYVFSVSATTRPPRSGERDGIDYSFVSDQEFDRLIAKGELVEWAEVHGHRYGTPHRNMESPASLDKHVVLDIDVQGAMQIRRRVPEAVLVFVFPPSAAALASRLSGRGTERETDMARRLTEARAEIERAAEFDYVVVNDDLEQAVDRVRAIVEAEAHRPSRALDMAGEIGRLQSQIDAVRDEQITKVNG